MKYYPIEYDNKIAGPIWKSLDSFEEVKEWALRNYDKRPSAIKGRMIMFDFKVVETRVPIVRDWSNGQGDELSHNFVFPPQTTEEDKATYYLVKSGVNIVGMLDDFEKVKKWAMRNHEQAPSAIKGEKIEFDFNVVRTVAMTIRSEG